MPYSKGLADEYLTALGREAAGYRAALAGRTFETVYLGGGTPSVLSPEQLTRLASIVRQNLVIVPGAEWTLEANPNSVSASLLSCMHRIGATRLSLGVQSFSDDLLAFLERPHSARMAIEAFEQAKNAGFDNVGLDFIYGIPGLTECQWRETLDTAIQLRPEHISLYSLSLDDGSRLKAEVAAGRILLPCDDAVAEQYELARAALSSEGYEQYELSNFCLPGHACRHNMNYWDRGEFLGLGPGAWSFLSNRRYRNVSDVSKYCTGLHSGATVADEEDFPDSDQASGETMMLALRTMHGLDLGRYGASYGLDRTRMLREKAGPLIVQGLMELEQGRLRLSKRGFLVAQQVFLRLFP